MTYFMSNMISLKDIVVKYGVSKKYTSDEIKETLSILDIISNNVYNTRCDEYTLKAYNVIFDKYDTLIFWRFCDTLNIDRSKLDVYNALAIIDAVMGKLK